MPEETPGTGLSPGKVIPKAEQCHTKTITPPTHTVTNPSIVISSEVERSPKAKQGFALNEFMLEHHKLTSS